MAMLLALALQSAIVYGIFAAAIAVFIERIAHHDP